MVIAEYQHHTGDIVKRCSGIVFYRPGVAGAVLQTPLLLINSFIISFLNKFAFEEYALVHSEVLKVLSVKCSQITKAHA